jgi:hypothetical protein
MGLKFDGQAGYSVAGVNFAAHYTDLLGIRHEVLCRATREAIDAICGETTRAPEALLAAFAAKRSEFQKLANAQFMAGIDRPHVTSGDVTREHRRDSDAA